MTIENAEAAMAAIEDLPGETPDQSGVRPEPTEPTDTVRGDEAGAATDQPAGEDAGETPDDLTRLQTAIDREREANRVLREQIDAANREVDEAETESLRAWLAVRRSAVVARAGVGLELAAMFGPDFREEHAESVAKAVRSEVVRRLGRPLAITGTPPAPPETSAPAEQTAIPGFK